MSKRKQKLELTWIGKENRPRLEPRILLEDPELSYHADRRVTENDCFDNKLIFGDNLLALKALEQEYAGKVKCIYIDPPFNTQQAFEHYDDGVEHSLWLSLIRDRVEILHTLLSEEGTFVFHIDDNELGYSITLLDEIFGRDNRAYMASFKQSSVSGPKAINPGLVSTASYILIYAKNKSIWRPKKLYVRTERDARYSKYISNYGEEHNTWCLEPLADAFARYKDIDKKVIKKELCEKYEKELEKFVLGEPERVVGRSRYAEKNSPAQ
jgi:adenine-specific DNA-methyltransferase